MAQCTVCARTNVSEIDEDLLAGGVVDEVAKKWGIARSTLFRHRAQCLFSSYKEHQKAKRRAKMQLKLLATVPEKEVVDIALAHVKTAEVSGTKQEVENAPLEVDRAGAYEDTMEIFRRLVECANKAAEQKNVLVETIALEKAAKVRLIAEKFFPEGGADFSRSQAELLERIAEAQRFTQSLAWEDRSV